MALLLSFMAIWGFIIILGANKAQGRVPAYRVLTQGTVSEFLFGPKSIFQGVCLFDLVFLALLLSFMAIWGLIIILGAPKAQGRVPAYRVLTQGS